MKVSVTQSCLTLWPHGLCPPGSSVHGSLQARTLEWVATPFSRGSSYPGMEVWSPALQVDSLPSKSSGNPRHVFLLACKYFPIIRCFLHFITLIFPWICHFICLEYESIVGSIVFRWRLLGYVLPFLLNVL